MSFKKYKGNDKYHIRVHKTIKHSAIIVDDDGINLYGYDTTTSEKKYKKHKNSYYPLKSKFTGKNKRSYMHKQRIADKRNRFSKPYNNAHLEKDDELYIDLLESKVKKIKKVLDIISDWRHFAVRI